MASVFLRGNVWWMSAYRAGARDRKPLHQWMGADWKHGPFTADKLSQKQAEELCADLAERFKAEDDISPGGPLTFKAYAERWLADRPDTEVASRGDEESRLKMHVYPAIGAMRLADIRPRHVRELVKSLRRKDSEQGGKLAPKTVRNIAATLRQVLHTAVVDELLDASPYVLAKGDLPPKVDKVEGWRDEAIFTKAEVERIISDTRIPEDRRMFYAVMFLGGLRFGEVAALRWRHYNEALKPLGRLTVAVSYSTRLKREKSTKTHRARKVPVHPTLAALLAAWKLGGFEQMMGRAPTDLDLLVPSRLGANRSNNHMKRKFGEDLETLELRGRRQHDARRTLTSIALDAGANRDMLKWITHGRPGDVLGDYTTLEWASLCQQIAPIALTLRKPDGADVIPLKLAAGDDRGHSVGTVTPPKTKAPGTMKVSGRSGGGVDGTRKRPGDVPPATASDDSDGDADPPSTLSRADIRAAVPLCPIPADPVGEALAAAAADWHAAQDRRELRKALRSLLNELED